jgi:signal transduction histidine kinase
MMSVGKVRRVIGDVLLALVLCPISIGSSFGAHNWQSKARVVDSLAIVLILVVVIAVAVRRTWPYVTLGVTTLVTTVYLTIGYPYSFMLLAVVVAVYTVARHRPFHYSLPSCLAALVLLLVHVFFHPDVVVFYGALLGSAWVVLPYAVGISVRLWRESIERDRAEALRHHLDEQRLQVAQEVHDIVGHGLAAIKMQADVALHLMARKPAQAEQALEAISRTSSEALEELRATLAVVRRTDGDAERAPAPTLARLPELWERMAEAGVTVDFSREGEERALPAVVDLAGYRIVQESLTNVLRHSGSGQATVRLTYGPEDLALAVSNPVRGPSQAGSGLGIPGMRQRVVALGGEFSAGPTEDGHFEVFARLPTGGHQ